MEGFPTFVYWFYLIPCLTSLVLGVLAAERGKLPEQYHFMPKTSIYMSMIFEACIPVLNIFSALAYGALNLVNL